MHTVDEDALKAATDATVFSDFIDSKKIYNRLYF